MTCAQSCPHFLNGAVLAKAALAIECRFQCFPLAGCEHLASPLLAPRDRLLEIDGGIERCHSRKRFDLCRDALFRPPQVRQEDQTLTVDFLQQQGATRQHLRQGLLDCRFRNPQRFGRVKLERSVGCNGPKP
jgi:hypothetical protein